MEITAVTLNNASLKMESEQQSDMNSSATSPPMTAVVIDEQTTTTAHHLSRSSSIFALAVKRIQLDVAISIKATANRRLVAQQIGNGVLPQLVLCLVGRLSTRANLIRSGQLAQGLFGFDTLVSRQLANPALVGDAACEEGCVLPGVSAG